MTHSISADVREKQKRRAILASYIGTTLEYYDFLLYGVAAALVFPKIFFVTLDPLTATLSSFATFAVGYFARPLGAVVFGHYGDRLGRKNVLVVTLVLMGLASVLIGLLPTYHQIGIAAPILLVILRLLQGVAIGGEWGGATLMSMEHAKPKGRGFAVSLVSAGGPTGAVLGTLVMTPFTLLPGEAFLSWGWRVPFLISALLMVLGLIIRLNVTETPEYEAARQARAAKPGPKAIPLVTVLRYNKRQILSGVFGGLAPLSFATFAAAFLLNYSVEVGHTRTSALIAMTIANFLNIFTLPLFGAISDRVGRRPMMITGALSGIVLIWPIFLLVHQPGFYALLLAMVLAMPVIQALMGGVYNTWLSEKFAADVRYSGIALTFQIASTLGAGLSPLIATSLLAASAGGTPQWVALYFGAVCLVSCIAYLKGGERFDAELPAHTVTDESPQARPEQASGGIQKQLV
ncbi:MFS transporter [Bordetella hinzii]|uniref:MFS transporter n=1 Tax=Bordetella hinzii TaxID=103855 RepID=UPI00045A200D|nr:MFS transporter [Bordetella hinzii]KCB46512.1 transporter, major facilitator family protein [Bordetella hinzii 4161]KXA74014.1 MFS transporter [Bordetella hinzii LMG 13501]QDJ37499.1 MFS transporter [Bordetella hinzii]VEH25568.1 metabolite transporter [Bordetella hinzii]